MQVRFSPDEVSAALDDGRRGLSGPKSVKGTGAAARRWDDGGGEESRRGRQ